MSKEIIKLSNLTKKFSSDSQKITIIKKVNLKFKSGDFVALTGPSGSGKSTLLHLIGLLDKPTSGEILIKGNNFSKASDSQRDEARKKNISIIYQQNNLLTDFSAIENVMIPLIINNISTNEAHKRAKKILHLVHLQKRLNHFPSELSGGEQQRVAVARALITNPKIILADEPTGSLDRKNAREVFNLISKFKSKDRAIIYATHNRELANKADYKLGILDGSIIRLNE